MGNWVFVRWPETGKGRFPAGKRPCCGGALRSALVVGARCQDGIPCRNVATPPPDVVELAVAHRGLPCAAVCLFRTQKKDRAICLARSVSCCFCLGCRSALLCGATGEEVTNLAERATSTRSCHVQEDRPTCRRVRLKIGNLRKYVATNLSRHRPVASEPGKIFCGQTSPCRLQNGSDMLMFYRI